MRENVTDAENCITNINVQKMTVKGNAIMITNLDEDRKYWKQPLLDLCPECMDEFEKWMKVGGTT